MLWKHSLAKKGWSPCVPVLGKLFNSLDSEFRCNTGMYSRAEVCGIHIPCYKPYNGAYTSHIHVL